MVVVVLEGVVKACLFTDAGAGNAGAVRGNEESPSDRFDISNGARTIGMAVLGRRSSVATRKRLTPTASIVSLK